MQNRVKFVELLTGMAEALGAEMSVAKLGIYENALSDLSDDQIEKAINIAAKTLRFFPKPLELLDLVGGNSEERAVMAWGLLLNTIKTVGKYQSIQFEDPKIAHVVEMMGGWVEVCSMPADPKETGIRMAQFLKMYKACGNVEPKQLAGISEKQRMLEGNKWAERVTPIQPVLVGANGRKLIEGSA
jgi:hypothetical protein